MVAREDHHIIRIVPLDEPDVLVDGVGGALVPVGLLALLVGGQHVDAGVHAVQVPGLAVADVLVELQRLVLGEHAHGLDAGVHAVGQGKVDDPVLSAVGHGGLGQVLGEHAQPAALAAGQKHSHDLLFG